MNLEMGVCRWAVNIAPWPSSSNHFSQLIPLLPSSEQSAILSYVKMEDQKRALVSRLLQRILVHSLFNIPYHDILIARTPEGKPYLANLLREQKFANFNFNVSHHGSYVVIASELENLVGVDVMAYESARTEYPLEYIDNFRSYFTKLEWQTICSSGLDYIEKYHQFYRYWCMKESFIKAIGVGLGFCLQRLEFYYPNGDVWGDIAHVRIDGKERRDWSFYLHKLPEEHWVCVAKGPVSETVEACNKPFSETIVTNGLYTSGSQLDNKPFTLLTLSEVIAKLRLCSM